MGSSKAVRHWIGLALAVVLGAGCAPPPQPPMEKPPAKQAKTPAAPAGGSGPSVAPMGGVGAGPMTPVSGSEGLQGGGSSAGSALKSKAKGVAEQAGSQTQAADQDSGN